MPTSITSSDTVIISTKSILKRSLLLGVGLSTLAMSSTAIAQDNTDPEEVIVTGTRQIIQDAIRLKRESVTVVDGLSADEIGDLPALSIGEALEQITSVGSQREGSGATEVSIRGLGPFLGSTVINGREATNGGGDRSVNFSQFPSELFNKLEVFKTQEANFIEGGVAGQIALSTLKPLEYGKRRFQVQAKGNIQPDNLNINDRARAVGHRFTGSYVDQWESNKFGEFGFSIGGQTRRTPNAEQEARSTSTFQACRLPLISSGNSCNDTESFRTFIEDEFDDGDDTRPFINGFEVTEDNLDNFTDAELTAAFLNLPSDNNGGDTFGASFINDADVQAAEEINPFTGQPFAIQEDFVLTSSSRSFRQNVTDDSRDSLFGAAQWRPNDRIDINIDAQYSDRTFEEIRSEISFEANDLEANGDSDLLDGFELQTTSSGALRVGGVSGPIEARTQFAQRSEEYFGGGANISFDVTDRLNVNLDASYSDTSRVEEIFRGRIGTSSRLIGIEILQNGTDGQQFTVQNTDVNDPSIFVDDNVEIQEDLNQFRNHEIYAFRGDVEYDIDNGFLSSFKAGGRYSVQNYDQLPRVRNEIEVDDGTDFLDGLFPSEIGGESVLARIELDIGNGDERGLANALGLGDAVGFGTLGNGEDLNNGTFEDVTGFIPGTAIPFTVDSNGDIDVTATAAEFLALGFGNDGDTDTPNDGFTNLGTLAAQACLSSEFIEDGFLDGETNGNLITNIDSDGNEIAAGTGNTFITFDGLCLPETLLGRGFSAPTPGDASVAELVQSVDIEEETVALYGQFGFDTTFEGLPLRGNIGLRYIDTTLTSNSFRGGFDVDVDEDGNITNIDVSGDINSLVALRDTFSYTEFLPSANVVYDINENFLIRGGAFRALSRPDPSDLGNGRSISTLQLDEETDDNATVGDFIGNIIANGNPRLEPFTSWNFDAAAEWYPNEDSILAVGVYHKTFKGGFQNSLQSETFTINGENVTVDVPVLTTTDDTSTIFGVEINAAHAFTYLPGVFGGLGFKASYNYADSDFEFEDGQFGEAVTLDQSGEIVSVREGFIPPANLVGLSDHTANGQIYWNIGDASIAAIGKYRSEFFQQFITTPLNLRFIDEAFVLDGRISYKVNDNLKVSLEGLNLLNTAREQFNPTVDNFAEINVFGPRIFLGITGKF